MDCREVSERLIDLVYEDATDPSAPQAQSDAEPQAERQAALAHVASCAHCRQQLAELKTTRALFAQLEDKEVPAVVSARILTQAVAQSQKRGPLQHVAAQLRQWLGPLALHPALGLAVVALFVLISSVALVNRTQPTRDVATRGTGPLLPDSHPAPMPAAPTMGAQEQVAESDGQAKERDSQQRLARRADEAKAGNGSAASRSSAFAEPPADWQGRDKKSAADAPARARANSTADDELAALQRGESGKSESASPGLAAPAKGDVAPATPPASDVAAETASTGAGHAKPAAKSAAPGASGLGALSGPAGGSTGGAGASNAALLSQAKQLRAQGKCAEAIPIFDALARQGTASAQSGEAASNHADCLARLARCAELQELSKRTGQAFTSALAACEVALRKAQKSVGADTDAQPPAAPPPSKK